MNFSHWTSHFNIIWRPKRKSSNSAFSKIFQFRNCELSWPLTAWEWRRLSGKDWGWNPAFQSWKRIFGQILALILNSSFAVVVEQWAGGISWYPKAGKGSTIKQDRIRQDKKYLSSWGFVANTRFVSLFVVLKFQHFDYIQYLGSRELAHMHGRDEYIQSNNVFSSTRSPQLALHYITAGILCKSWMEIGIHSIFITLDS